MNVHDQLVQAMKEMQAQAAAQGVTLLMPPPSNQTLGTRYTALEPGKRLEAMVDYDARFANPLGYYQGGFLCAALDEVYGPLTYMVAQGPAVTIEMSTTFVRPFTAADESMTVAAELVVKNRTLLVLKAEAKTKAGKLLATSTTHCLIVEPKPAR